MMLDVNRENLCICAATDSCPESNPFREWAQWTEQCLWFPLETIRDAMVQNCDIVIKELDKVNRRCM